MNQPARIDYINPEGLPKNPAYTNAIAVSGAVKTIYIGAQLGTNATGLVGKGDIGAQTEQALKNIEAILRDSSATWEHVIKINVYLVEGQPLQPGFEAAMKIWGGKPNPPINTVMYVSSLGRDGFLVAIEAIAVVPLQ